MAIGKYSAVPPPPESPPPTHHHHHHHHHPQQANGPAPAAAPTPVPHAPHHGHSASGTIDIEAWTISALESLSVSPDSRGTGGTPLAIPLDGHHGHPGNVRGVTIALGEAHAAGVGITPPRRPPSRRDSMRRREALLKGKEGSRQRRRWDMARLTDVPHVEPPQPSDWEPRPVYPIHHIPYHVAQYWDRGLRQQVEDKGAARAAASRKNNKNKNAGAGGENTTTSTTTRGRVPRDLRDKVKRTPGVKGWVRTLEEPVRQFLVGGGAAAGGPAAEGEDESDFSDDEVVFVGRKGVSPRDGAGAGAGAGDGWKKAHLELHDRPVDRGMIYDPFDDGESGAFKRWLTHSISDYYGLDSRSVTMANPARRCVYVGIRELDVRRAPQICAELPRPLWELF